MLNASADTSSASAPGARTRLRYRRLAVYGRTVVLPVAVVIATLLVWELIVRLLGIPEFLLPAPSQIYVDTVAMGVVMVDHTVATLNTIMIGFVVSILISLPLAVMITSSPLIANAIYPLLVLTQSIPKVALAPILVVVFGAGETSRVLVTFLVAFFPLVISVAAGLISVPPELIELSRSLKSTKLQELTRIRLPYAVPFVFSGLKLSITFAVVGAVVGEFVAADKGLGYQILSATAFFRTPVAFGSLVILSVMGIALFQAVVLVERVFFPWSVQEERSAA